MAFVLSDRVKETSTSTGYSDLSLGGAFGGFQTFGLGVGDGNSTYYAIENSTRWEVGIGTYTSATNTLSRDTVLASSSSDEKIYLDGVSYVFVTYPAGKAFVLNPDGVATGISGHAGIAFPDGTTQTTAVYLSGVGFDGTIPFWDGTQSFTYDADLKWDSSSQTLINNQGTELSPTTKLPLKLTRTNAGNLFHAYVDNGWDRTIGLHLTDSSGPTWKLGLKSGPSSDTAEPDQGYVFGNNGSAGMYPASDTYFLMNYLDGFWVNHKGASMLNIDKAEGASLTNNGATVTAITVKGAIGQSAKLQEWKNSSDTVLLSVDKQGAIVLDTTIADGDSPNSSFFYSSTSGTLAFKNSAGTTTYWGGGGGGGSFYYAGSGLSLVGDTFHAVDVYTASGALRTDLDSVSAIASAAYTGTGDILVDEYIKHNGNTNTSIRFNGDDLIDLRTGNWSMVKMDKGNNKITVNNSNQNVDFRVNSDDGTQLIRTDAGLNRVGIGTGSPDYLLDVAGTGSFETIRFSDGTTQATAGGGVRSYANITADSTITTSNDLVFADSTAGQITVTLPSAISNGGVNFTIKKTDSSSNSVIISGSETIDGQASVSLFYQNESLTVTSNNSVWFII